MNKSARPLLVPLFIFAVGVGYSYLDWIDFFEPTVPEVLSEQSIPIVEETVEDVQKRDCPEVFRGDNDKEIILVNNLCHTVRVFSDQELGLEISDRWDSLRGGHQVIQTENLFYFLATSSLRCGAQNCTYNLYRYDESLDSLTLVATDIFGLDVRLYLSPGGGKMAIVRRAHAFVCDERSYLELVDFADGKRLSVDKFQDPELEVAHIDDLHWPSDTGIEITTTHGGGCDPSEHTIRHKRFLYDLETDKIESELLEEREVIP